MDYQNRIMAGNPNLLKYGQVIGGPGMGIAGPGTAPGATPPTQAQMNQMMQNNPMGYMDFADLVKTYSADPYKGLQEEIKDVVGGRDTGYMSGQDYYDINVLGLDGRGIAEKYGLEYADGGRVGLFMGGPALEGQALSIYESMNAYGFSDQEIANALEGQGLYTPGSTPVVEEPVANTVQNIINQGGGDGPPGPDPTGTKTYGKTFTGMTMPDGTPIGSSGVVEGVGIIDGLKNAATGLFDLYSKFSPIGIFSNFMKQRAEKQQEIQDNAIDKARKEREMQEAIAEAERKERERAAQYGATNYGRGADGQQSYSGDAVGAPGLGFGVGATTGGPVSNRTGRGRQDYSKGGLATMFVEKR